MNKKRLRMIIGVLLLVVVVLLLPRTSPQKIIENIPLTDGWGSLHVNSLQQLDNYVVADVTFEAKKDFQPTDHWFIKDRTRIGDIPGGVTTKWHGYIYLVKSGLYSWKAIK